MMLKAVLTEDALKRAIFKRNSSCRHIPTKINTRVPLEIQAESMRVNVPTTAKIKILQRTYPLSL